jgi:O-antigen/teichoic acid export membrane protein
MIYSTLQRSASMRERIGRNEARVEAPLGSGSAIPAPRAPLRRMSVVARNAAAVLGAQLVIKLLGFGFSVYVVRRLGDAQFGRYSSVIAYVAVTMMLTDLGTSTYSAREMARRDDEARSMVPDISALRVLLSLLVGAGLALAAWLVHKPPDIVVGVCLASAGVLVYAVQGPLETMLIARERLDSVARLRLINQVVYVVLGAALLLTGSGYLGLLVASLAGVLAMLLACTYIVAGVWRIRFDRPQPRHWRSLLRSSWPFAVSAAAGELARRFDTVFMSFALTDAAVGWYNVPFNLILMTLLVPQALGTALFPSLVKEYDSGRGSIRDTVRRAVRYVLLLSLPMSLGGMLLAEPIIHCLYGSAFAPAVPVMRVIVWALPGLFLAEILGRTANTMHLERRVAPLSVVAALLNVAFVVTLVPSYGTPGAALAMVATAVAGVVLSSLIIGPRLLWGGSGWMFVRLGGSAVIMSALLLMLRGSGPVARLPAPSAMLLLVSAGALAFAVSAWLFGAVSTREIRLLGCVLLPWLKQTDGLS